MTPDLDNIKIKKLEKENADLKLRLSIKNQSLILDNNELTYLKLLVDLLLDEIKET